jgi:hypothetical protein
MNKSIRNLFSGGNKRNYTYLKSALNKNNDNSKDKISYCVVIPFSTDYHSINICRKDIKKIVGWNYDEIIISKKDYEKLLHKTKKLKIFNKLNPELNLNL